MQTPALSYFLTFTIIFLAIALACRELTCWYFKINKIITLLTIIADSKEDHKVIRPMLKPEGK